MKRPIEHKEINMSIRLEQPGDYREVENLVRESFWNVYRPGALEHYVLHRLRDDPAFVRELVSGYLGGVTGEYATSEGYFVCQQDPAGFAAFDATFPPKEKLKLPGQLFAE